METTSPPANTIQDNLPLTAQVLDDDLRPEYDEATLRQMLAKGVRGKFAAPAAQPALTVTLEPDVAAVFDTPEAVNAALRFLIKVTKDNAHEALPGVLHSGIPKQETQV